MKRALIIVTALCLVLSVQARAQAAPAADDDVWRMIGVDPDKAPSLDSFADKILFAFAKTVRTLSVLSIPIAVSGVLIGALVWGIGALSHNERVKKGGVVTMLSMIALPVLARLAPLLVASFAQSF
jgi:hypothetical protein